MRIPLFLLATIFTITASAQTEESIRLNLTSPLDYQVFQRQTKAEGRIVLQCALETRLRGALTNLDGLEARLVGGSMNGKTASEWQALPFDNRVRRFRAEIPVPAGGWYRLEVRLLDHGTNVATKTVEHVGVGEVFAIAGQSNSANHGEEKQTAKSPLVVAFGKGRWQPAADPEPGASGTGGKLYAGFR